MDLILPVNNKACSTPDDSSQLLIFLFYFRFSYFVLISNKITQPEKVVRNKAVNGDQRKGN